MNALENKMIDWLQGNSTEEESGKAIINFLSISAIMICLTFAVINFAQNNTAMIKVDIAVVGLCLLVFVLNFFGNFQVSRSYFFVLANGSLLAISWLTPSNNGYFLYYFPVIVATFIIFEHNANRNLLLFNGLTLLAAVVSMLMITYYDLPVSEQLERYSAINLAVNFISSLITTGILLVFWQLKSKVAKEAYLAETSRINSLIENNREGIWMIDREFRIIAFNQVFVQFCHAAYGKTPRKGMKLEELANDTEEKDFWFTKYQRAYDNGRFTDDFHYSRNGFQTILKMSFNPIFNLKNELIGISCYAKDITRRMTEAEALQQQKRKLQEMATALQESEKRYELAIKGANSGIWDWDITTNQVFHSPIWENMLGYQGSELPDMDINFVWSLIHPDDRERAKTALQNHLKENLPYKEEIRIRRKDGTYRWYLEIGQAQWNEKGAPERMVGSITDITSRKEAEESNRSNSQLLSMILDNLPVVICRLDAEGNIVRLKGSALNKMKITAKDQIGKRANSFIPSFQSEFLQRVKEEGIVRFESCLNIDGKNIFFDNALFMEGEDRYIGFSIDITPMHHFQEELVAQNHMLEKANEELDRFVYSASHDLRAPLKSILGLIKIAGIDTQDAQQHLYLDMIRQSVAKLETFIEDIVEYSRNSRLEITPEQIDFTVMVNEVMENLRFLPQAEQIKLKLNIPENLSFYSDVWRIQTLLNNLLSNAVKYHDFSKENPFIAVSVHYLPAGNGLPEAIELKVEDNGKGIAPEYHSRIFDMFFRATESSNGSGLGLYIVREIMEKLHAKMNFISAEDVGTTFKIQIPFLPAPSAE